MCSTPTCEGAKQLAEMLAEVTAALKEMREVSACACRVLINNGAGLDQFIDELRRVGIPDGFGKRTDELLAKLEA